MAMVPDETECGGKGKLGECVAAGDGEGALGRLGERGRLASWRWLLAVAMNVCCNHDDNSS